jgi:hypothetical protein
MSSPTSIHARTGSAVPAAAPEAALQLVARQHARTLQQCATLQKLAVYLAECGCDSESRHASETVLRYFDTCPPLCFRDEEEDLFPALLESMAGSDAVCLREMTCLMAEQHRALERDWARLREPLSVIAQGGQAALDTSQVDAFVSAYRIHVECERTELLPVADRLLSDEALEQVGGSMRRRHGV